MIINHLERVLLGIVLGALSGLLTGIIITSLVGLLYPGSTFLHFAVFPDPPGAGSGVGAAIGLLVSVLHTRPWVGGLIGTLVGLVVIWGVMFLSEWGAITIPLGRLLIYALLLLSHTLMGWIAAWGSVHWQRRAAHP